MKKRFLTLALMAVMSVGGVTALAETESVGGGTWEHNLGSVVSSEYYHSEKIHGSSVRNGNNQKDTDYNVDPGDTSDASIKATSKGTNKAYYCLGSR